jgi:hypothetical protein
VHRRQEELLRADPGHLFTDDVDDLRADPHREREQRAVASHQLPDEGRSHQQAVAGGFGVGGILTKRRDVGLRPAHDLGLYSPWQLHCGRSDGSGTRGDRAV